MNGRGFLKKKRIEEKCESKERVRDTRQTEEDRVRHGPMEECIRRKKKHCI